VNSHSVRGCGVIIAGAKWEAAVYNIPKRLTFKNGSLDLTRSLACSTVKIYGAGIVNESVIIFGLSADRFGQLEGAADILGKGGAG
jgi:hypothetical protein